MWLFGRKENKVNTNQSVFAKTISIALKNRRAHGAMAKDPQHKQPVYVVRMCEELHRQVVQAGNPQATLQEVLRIERSAMGHADYAAKLDLRLRRLAGH